MFPDYLGYPCTRAVPTQRLTGVAVRGGPAECAQALAPLVSGAQSYSIHRSQTLAVMPLNRKALFAGERMRSVTIAASLLVFCSLLPDRAIGQSVGVTRVHVNGVDMTYVERGRGEPLILLHGGQGDYRSWEPQVEAFSGRFRVISYSRRYNYPNDNPITADYRSAFTDADDLAALIRHLGLGSVHLVGISAGALAALVLAIEKPEMVRTLVLAEPPVHSWARNDPSGQMLYKEFMKAIWIPAGAAFKAGDDQGAMRILVDGFGGTGRFDALPR